MRSPSSSRRYRCYARRPEYLSDERVLRVVSSPAVAWRLAIAASRRRSVESESPSACPGAACRRLRRSGCAASRAP
jgi:hypothetical protein